MSDSTRRTFLLRSGAGAAAVGAAAMVPGTAQAATGSAAPAAAATAAGTGLPAGARGPIVAYIDDLSSGDISVLVGDRAVVVHDPGFVAALAHAAARP